MSETPQKLTASTIGNPSPRRITIIGAGVAGLTLACLLQKQNIPFTIYEARNATTIGHSYSITLFRRPWRNLINRLSSKHATFRQDTAADRLLGGTGKLLDQSPEASATFQAVDRDVRLWLIQRLQEKGIDINWDHKLTNISETETGKGASLSFEKSQAVEADIIVDAGGLRSPAFENHLGTAPKPKLLPYATYNGSRRMKASDFSKDLEHHFRTGNMIELIPESPDAPFIQIKKVHLPAKDQGSNDHNVDLRWVYSRPAREGTDPIYRPNRTPEEAKNIPNDFYDEMLASIDRDFSTKKRSMLKSFFDLSALHNDRILNWHLRLRLPRQQYFVENTDHGSYQVIAIGDAAHGLPIVQSKGAGLAVKDATDLAWWLQEVFTEGFKHSNDNTFYNNDGVPREWFREAVGALQRLRRCHAQSPLTRQELEETIGFWVEDVDEGSQDQDEASSSSDTEQDQQETKGKL